MKFRGIGDIFLSDVNTLKNVEEMDRFLDMYELPKLNQKAIKT